MRKGKDPDPDPYVSLMDSDPGGPKTWFENPGKVGQKFANLVRISLLSRPLVKRKTHPKPAILINMVLITSYRSVP
jgi:hypothetical protein